MTILENLTYEEDGLRLAGPCLWFEIFFEHAQGPEVLDFYEKARALLGTRLSHYDLGDGRTKRWSARAETLVPTWCGNPTYARGKQYFMLLGGAPEGTSDAQIKIAFWPRKPDTEPEPGDVYPYSSVACSIPLDHPLLVEDGVIDWLGELDIVANQAFISGSCGIAMNFSIDLPTMEQTNEARRRVAAAIQRYPGLDVPGYGIGIKNRLLRIEAQTGGDAPRYARRTFVKRVNWLTFLNRDQVALLDEQNQFSSRIANLPDVMVRELKHGIAIRAGERPSIGDTAKGDWVSVYQSVGALVRPVRVESVTGSTLVYALEQDGVARWLGAFDTPQ